MSQIVVDDHATDKHSDVTDDIILDLVRLLDGIEQTPDDTKEPYQYFATLLPLGGKRYRLVGYLNATSFMSVSSQPIGTKGEDDGIPRQKRISAGLEEDEICGAG